MAATELLYMSNMQQLECEATVEAVLDEEKTVVILDQTVFYPQGGGQPYDTGKITGDSAVFIVDEVRFVDSQVHHKGHFEKGRFMAGDAVHCKVDTERRQLHARLHSGGHVVDMAVNRLGLDWVPGKGYHFPDGPYVEYSGELDPEAKDKVIAALDAALADILSKSTKTDIKFMDKSEMAAVCHHVPDYLPEGKPSRVVLYGDFGVPCGGTHVADLQDIGSVTIRKIKGKQGTIKVAYQVEDKR